MAIILAGFKKFHHTWWSQGGLYVWASSLWAPQVRSANLRRLFLVWVVSKSYGLISSVLLLHDMACNTVLFITLSLCIILVMTLLFLLFMLMILLSL